MMAYEILSQPSNHIVQSHVLPMQILALLIVRDQEAPLLAL